MLDYVNSNAILVNKQDKFQALRVFISHHGNHKSILTKQVDLTILPSLTTSIFIEDLFSPEEVDKHFSKAYPVLWKKLGVRGRLQFLKEEMEGCRSIDSINLCFDSNGAFYDIWLTTYSRDFGVSFEKYLAAPAKERKSFFL